MGFWGYLLILPFLAGYGCAHLVTGSSRASVGARVWGATALAMLPPGLLIRRDILDPGTWMVALALALVVGLGAGVGAGLACSGDPQRGPLGAGLGAVATMVVLAVGLGLLMFSGMSRH